MKFKKILTVVLTFTMIFTAASAIMAQNISQRRHFGPNAMDLTRLVEDLNLSESQKEAVEAIIARYKDGEKSLVEDLRKARQQLFSVIFAEEFNEDNVRQTFQQASSSMEELVVLKAKMIAELRTVLSPEQTGYLKGRMDALKNFRDFRPPRMNRFFGPNSQ